MKQLNEQDGIHVYLFYFCDDDKHNGYGLLGKNPALRGNGKVCDV